MNNSATIDLASGLVNTMFSILILLRLWRLRKETIKVIPAYSGSSSLVQPLSTSGLLLTANLYSLAGDVLQKDRHRIVVPVTSFVATALLCPLIYLERMRSIRPADIAVVFLLVSLGLDIAVAIQDGLEQWLMPATKLTLKLLLVVTESRSKQRVLKSPYSSQSPEELAGILSRTFFWWINPILALGNQIILSGDDLPPIDHLLTSGKLRRDGLKGWDQRAKPLTKMTLPICLVKSMLPQFMAPVILRLCLIFFRYAQPALISSAVRILSSNSDGVFEAVYHHRLNRLSIMTKGTLVGLINNAALRQSSSNYNDGIALTLISTDTESVMRFASMFHETWAHIVETEALLQKLRAQELEMAKKVRWMMVAYNASANALGIFSPILTFVIFVLYANLRGSTLDAETAFTTTALLGLVTHPANMIMTILPRAIGSLAAFGRIQDYLVQPGRADERRLFKPKTKDDDSSLAICFDDVTVQSHSSSRPILENVNFTVNQGSVFICAGAVGSGKTILARCILGEIPTSSGTISVSTKRIAYCEQSPWLPSGTLKEAVCGFGNFEPGWYRHIVKLCCLDEDISALPLGDDTLIGSRGLKLSGGQRQRFALARAVYARCEIVLLDDSFSALDHNTEGKVVFNLLGTHGHFRKTGTTVILIANSTKHFSLADSLIILENGRVTYQGSPNAINEEAVHLRQAHINATVSETNTGFAETNKTIHSQALEVTEAMADLVLASEVDGITSLTDEFLYRRLPHPFTPRLDSHEWVDVVNSYVDCANVRIRAPPTLTFHCLWRSIIVLLNDRDRLNTESVAYPIYLFMLATWLMTFRFSEDIQLVDKSLPPAILSLSNQIFKLLVQAALLFSAQKLLTATLPICIMVVYIVQRVYLRTSRQLRLLQLESQSAVYSSFLESLWLNIVLDLVIAAMAVILITLAVFLEGSTTAGQIGMSLNIVLVANSTLLSLVTSWTNLEISLGAISRLKTLEANTVAEEQPASGAVVSNTWPSCGAVEVRDLTVSYEETNVPALKNINLSIEPGQHLVICGRTGSGKSTLLLALLRLLSTQSGAIVVDGIDLNLVPLSIIRERCFITVTQDPFLLAQASLRFNLDPSETLSDNVIMKALERTGLCGHFDTNPAAKLVDILDDPLSSLPHMSTGQTQLFALTRAILRAEHSSVTGTKSILLLDEATSSVDGLTELTMRHVVKEAFTDNGHTVIEITHRLSSFEGIARTGGQSQQVKVILLSQGEIQSQGRIEDVLDLDKEP
ncbi:hypothetical protein FPANT_2150 [Fusarium pseudoanthophilum]|uniref:ABC transporter n=1 Tax=Fusarium pseudoanthophilum TaxID=48495 RepID=A0A8H5PQA6_9HYPO|nr:hypothetical protein FPANT_2150 [Fusarium pseudoanthophilum]